MDKSNYITMSQLAMAMGLKRTAVYHYTDSLGVVSLNGVLCVPRHAALAYVREKKMQHAEQMRILDSAEAEIMTFSLDDDEVTE
jgi:hypothetical protein